MAEYFQIPEVGTKVRPGSYFNVDKNGDDDSFGAIDGVVVAVFKATFGPVDKVTVLERGDDYTTIYGDGLTTDLIREVLYGGAKKVICCRLNGTGGAVASVSLAAATGKIKITAKHPGEMPFSVAYVARFTKDCKCYSVAGKTQAKLFPIIKKNAVVDVMKYTETVKGKRWYFIRIPYPNDEGFVREFVPAGYFKKLI